MVVLLCFCSSILPLQHLLIVFEIWFSVCFFMHLKCQEDHFWLLRLLAFSQVPKLSKMLETFILCTEKALLLKDYLKSTHNNWSLHWQGPRIQVSQLLVRRSSPGHGNYEYFVYLSDGYLTQGLYAKPNTFFSTEILPETQQGAHIKQEKSSRTPYIPNFGFIPPNKTILREICFHPTRFSVRIRNKTSAMKWSTLI